MRGAAAAAAAAGKLCGRPGRAEPRAGAKSGEPGRRGAEGAAGRGRRPSLCLGDAAARRRVPRLPTPLQSSELWLRWGQAQRGEEASGARGCAEGRRRASAGRSFSSSLALGLSIAAARNPAVQLCWIGRRCCLLSPPDVTGARGPRRPSALANGCTAPAAPRRRAGRA